MMKKIVLSLFIVFGISKISAQSVQFSQAEVKEVTVYTNGADITNISKVNLPQGAVKLVLQNVARNLDINTVQVSGPDGMTVLSISQELNSDVEAVHPVHKRLKDSLEVALARKDLLVNKQSAAQGALKILNNDKLLSGGGNVDLGDLSKLVDYYQVKAVELNTAILKLQKDILVQDKQIAKLQEQIRGYAGDGGQLALQLVNSKVINGVIGLSYISYDANWQAYYDLRAKSISAPLDIFYKAKVTQYTGVDWKNVKLTLSTGNPSQSGTAPLLNPSYATFAVSIQAKANGRNMLQNRVQSIGTRNVEVEEVSVADAAQLKKVETPVTVISENQLSATFDIEVPYDVLSNGQPHSVTLKEYAHPAKFKYYAVPKADKDAFLMAEITDFEKLNLVPGEANVIFENMFVGTSYIDPSVTTDTLNLSLGRDKSLSIKRERIMGAKSSQVSGGSKRQVYTYEIRVRNTKSSAVNLLLKDQYPISTDKAIEIELTDNGGAEVNKENGVLTWKLTVQPGETQTYRFTFTVKHPKDRNVFFN